MPGYSLKIAATDPNSNNREYLIVANTTEVRTLKLTSSSGASWFANKKITLDSLSFHKEIYKPGYVYIKLNIGYNTKDAKPILGLRVDEIIKAFTQATIELASDEMPIAQEYNVFDIQPKLLYSASESIYVEMKAYSPDQYMTLNTNCTSYTGQTISYIFNSELGRFKAMKDSTQKNKLTENLRHITNSKIPYAVQYNESTYNFLARLSNRYGEFMYYENTSLHLGLDKETDHTINIDKYISATYNNQTTDNFYNDIYNNYINGFSKSGSDQQQKSTPENQSETSSKEDEVKKNNAATAEACNRLGSYDVTNYEGMAIEYMSPIKDKDFFKSSDFFKPDSIALDLLASSLSEQTLASMIFKTAKAFTLKAATATAISQSKNNEYITRIGAVRHPGVIYNDGKTDTKKKIDLNFYSKVRAKGKGVGNSKINIDLGNNVYKDLKLGSVIIFQGIKYIVTTINGSETTTTTDIGTQELKTTWLSGIKITAIPYDKDNIYPYIIEAEHIRTSKPQTAIVVDNVDPNRLSRVRIRYPWQPVQDPSKFKESIKDASPWIRLSRPMASSGHGFNFLPEIGDEVIVNYECGNIERPYIEGSLYNTNRKPAMTKDANNTKSISSTNGHKIKFYDNPNGNATFTKTLPGFSLIDKFIPGYIKNTDSDFRAMTGYIEITDAYGLYSVKMSSEDRQVSITSTYGDVKINALTGITISAPNGDVTIKGKNIKLEAGNNVTITSGANIATGFFRGKSSDKKGSVLNIFKTATSSTLKQVIDLSFLRTVIEIFLRPIGGTMTIKSHRYLCLEAGKGKATILNENYRKNMKMGSLMKAGFAGISSQKSFKMADVCDNNIFNALTDTKAFLDNLSTYSAMFISNLATFNRNYSTIRTNLVTKLGNTNNELTHNASLETLINTQSTNIQNAFKKITKTNYPNDLVANTTIEETQPFSKEILVEINALNVQPLTALATEYNAMYEAKSKYVKYLNIGHNKSAIYNAAFKIFKNPSGYKAKLAEFLGVYKINKADTIDNKLFTQVYIGTENAKKAAYRSIMTQVFLHVINNPKDYKYPEWANYGDPELIKMVNASVSDHFSNANLPKIRPKGLDKITTSALLDNQIEKYTHDDWSDAILALKQQNSPTILWKWLHDTIKFMGDEIKKSSGLEGMLDQNVWDQNSTGEILISNKKGSTLCFNNTGIEDFKPAEYATKEVEIRTLLTGV